ncbi:hypothetical protein AQJ23_45310 [Streptomyces antibioticus]|nr:hypothetical protein [Streptomyces antibioticus]KUN16221.1 hypothetical protein AQJ23_45310 [Streptomyces antibioticus]
MAKLKPISPARIAEAREEAYAVLARLMGRLAPGEHVVRLGVTMDGEEKPLAAALRVTVEGDGGLDDLVGAEEKYLDNMAFLLMVGLAQPLSYGTLYLRSPAPDDQSAAYVVRAWHLAYCALSECTASEAAELIGERGPAVFVDAFGLHGSDEDEEGEAVYPPVAYTVL